MNLRARGLTFVAVCISASLMTACSHQPRRSSVPTVGGASVIRDAPFEDRSVLAGEWDYVENGVAVTLTLNQVGNGAYDFKGGRFTTHSLTDHTWIGTWAQRENDREGGFEITLSADYTEGDGRWWYTRIEEDRAPTKPGGRFRVIKNRLPLDAQSRPASAANPCHC